MLMPSVRVTDGINIPARILPASRRKGLVLVALCKRPLKGREALLERRSLFRDLRAQPFDLLSLFLSFVQQHRHQLMIMYGNHLVSRPGESHPQALAEPYLNVSAHTAPIIQPSA